MEYARYQCLEVGFSIDAIDSEDVIIAISDEECLVVHLTLDQTTNRLRRDKVARLRCVHLIPPFSRVTESKSDSSRCLVKQLEKHVGDSPEI